MAWEMEGTEIRVLSLIKILSFFEDEAWVNL